MIQRNIGDEVKFQEWHFGKITEINGNLVTIQLATGGKVIKDASELRTNKKVPKFIDIYKNIYRVRYRGELVGYFKTEEEAVSARDEYLKNKKK